MDGQHVDGDGAKTGTRVEASVRKQDGNGDGSRDGVGTGTGRWVGTRGRTHDGNGVGHEISSGDRDGDGNGYGERRGGGGELWYPPRGEREVRDTIGERAEERRRCPRNPARVVDAMWDTGETWAEIGENVDKERVGSVAADRDNLENRAEGGGGGARHSGLNEELDK